MIGEEILVLLIVFAAAGFVLGKIPKKEKAEEEAPSAFFDEEKAPEMLTLRSGFNVTKDKKPTLAEQWVNIMNYSGENQKEENYEETTEDYTAENLG